MELNMELNFQKKLGIFRPVVLNVGSPPKIIVNILAAHFLNFFFWSLSDLKLS